MKIQKRFYSSNFEQTFIDYKYIKPNKKNDLFDIIRNEYLKLLDNRASECWLFKGHSEYSWKLETKIERDLKNYPISNDRNQIENILLREFQRKASLYLQKCPE